MKNHPVRWVVAGLALAVGTALLMRTLVRVWCDAGPIAKAADAEPERRPAEKPAAPRRLTLTPGRYGPSTER